MFPAASFRLNVVEGTVCRFQVHPVVEFRMFEPFDQNLCRLQILVVVPGLRAPDALYLAMLVRSRQLHRVFLG